MALQNPNCAIKTKVLLKWTSVSPHSHMRTWNRRCARRKHVTWFFPWGYWPRLSVYDQIMMIEQRVHHSWRDKRILPLTHDVEAAVEFADAVPCPPLPHLPDLHPLVQMGVEALDAGQRSHAVVASHGVHKVLAERVQWAVSTAHQSQLDCLLCSLTPSATDPTPPLGVFIGATALQESLSMS